MREQVSTHGAAVAEPLRLDEEHRQKLAAIAAIRATSVDAALNDLIDRSFAEIDYQVRAQAAERIGKLSLETVPDPQVLARELDEVHALPDLP
jgi:hypothetical protein